MAMVVTEVIRRHEALIVIVISATASLLVAKLVPIDSVDVLEDSSIVTILGVILGGALAEFAVIQPQIQALREQVALVPNHDKDDWKEVARIIGHLEGEIRQDVCYVLAMFVAAFVGSCVMPSLSGIDVPGPTGLSFDYLFGAFKIFSVITSAAALHDVIKPVSKLTEALIVVKTHNSGSE